MSKSLSKTTSSNLRKPEGKLTATKSSSATTAATTALKSPTNRTRNSPNSRRSQSPTQQRRKLFAAPTTVSDAALMSATGTVASGSAAARAGAGGAGPASSSSAGAASPLAVGGAAAAALGSAAMGGGGTVPGHKRTLMEADFDRLRAIDKLDDDIIGPKGFAALMSEVGFPNTNPSSREGLVLAYNLHCAQFLFITRAEWSHAVFIHNLDHLGVLEQRCKEWLESTNTDIETLRGLYTAVFDMLRPDDSPSLPLDTAMRIWKLLLTPDVFPLQPLWLMWCTAEFRKPVSRDMYKQTFLFATTVASGKGNGGSGVSALLEDFDTNSVWPSAIDDFVDFVRRKGAAAAAARAEKTAEEHKKR